MDEMTSVRQFSTGPDDQYSTTKKDGASRPFLMPYPVSGYSE